MSNDLEKLIDRELKELPLPPAPSTLLPRVLAAVEGQIQPSWDRWVWRSWPPVLRLVSAGVMGVIVVGLAVMEPLFQSALREALAIVVQPVTKVTSNVWTAIGAVEVLRRALIEPFLGYFVVLGIMMGTACAGLGAALARMTRIGGEST